MFGFSSKSFECCGKMIFRILTVLLMFLTSCYTNDYCAHEYFKPECGEDEARVMEKATYGRMKTSKCLDIEMTDEIVNDPKYFGCKADVLDVLDRKCSGLRTCSVLVIDPELLKRSNCYRELMQYLSAEYSCIPVFKADQTCSIGLAGNAVYLSSETGVGNLKIIETCGSPNNPWSIETSLGQNINVSLLLFGINASTDLAEANGRMSRNNYRCSSNSYGYDRIDYLGKITEPNDKNTYKICPGKKRQGFVLSSNSNKIEMELNKDLDKRFILKFEATGCYDLKPPQDAWMKREGNEITVGCFMNRHTWKLTCNGRNWIGVIGNCTQQSQDRFDITAVEVSLESQNPDNIISKVFMTIVGSCSLILAIMVLLCGFLICRQRLNKKKQNIGNGVLSTRQNGQYYLPTDTSLNRDADNTCGDASKRCNDQNNGVSHQDPCYFVLENDKDDKTLK